MKCDVCDTKIPIGSQVCPNCGYKMGKTHVNTYDASGKSHDHIQVTTKSKSYVNDPFSNSQIKVVALVVVSVIIFVLIAVISIPKYIESGQYVENPTYQELIDKGYDEELINLAIEDKEDLVDFFKTELGAEDPDINEYSEKKDGDTRLETEVSAYFDDRVYSIKYIYTDGPIVRKSMYTIRDSTQSIKDAATLKGDQDELNAIGDKIGVKDLYDIIDRSRLLLEPDKDDDKRLIYQKFDDELDIYLSEQFYADAQPSYYSYYFSIVEH